ncbi:hypothetical protein E4U58_003567 [Claviceps cyperi]|nr:hypothetical protein E4U58_003567 [Claviceps cyperi]
MVALAPRHLWRPSQHTKAHHRPFLAMANNNGFNILGSNSPITSHSSNKTTINQDRKWDTISNKAPFLLVRDHILLKGNMVLPKVITDLRKDTMDLHKGIMVLRKGSMVLRQDSMDLRQDSMDLRRDNSAQDTFLRSGVTTRGVS